MSLDLTHLAAPTQTPLPSAWLIAANETLTLSSAELHQFIQEEQRMNPALEVEEHSFCPDCGRALREPPCPHCHKSAAPAEPGIADPPLLDEGLLWPAGASGGQAEEWVDPLLFVPAQVDWKARLEWQLHLHMPAQDAPLIEYLVGSLDADGRLSCPLEEVAQLFAVPLSRVEAVLVVLQSQEPAGIGARTVQECLLLQVQRLEVDAAQAALVVQIITHHLKWLGQGKGQKIARRLGCSRLRVDEAIACIKVRLTPFPLRGDLGPDLRTGEPPPRTLLPDVIISRRSAEEGGGYEVEIAEAERFGLSINASYLQAARALRGTHDVSSQHVQDSLVRTRRFITNVKHRWETLASLTQCLIELQPEFLTQGRAALRPLTHAQVAAHLGLHPSTISRAIADKYVLLPNAEVVPFSLFFESSWSTKEALKEILSQETRPLSDQELTERLQARGIAVARRTVTKYRSQLRVLPSVLR